MKRYLAAVAAAGLLAAFTSAAQAANIIDEWASVKASPPPALKPVTVDPKTTALIMADFMKQNCGQRPRCLTTVPAVKKLLDAARAAKATVLYTKFGNTTFNDIVDPGLAPAVGDPSVTSFADKFVNSDLDKQLKDKGIKTIIIVGTAANGVILYTGTDAAARGYDVIVPVDGISGVDTYTEQFSVWQLANAPTYSKHIKITKSDMIKF